MVGKGTSSGGSSGAMDDVRVACSLVKSTDACWLAAG